jgi:hypothetical protein
MPLLSEYWRIVITAHDSFVPGIVTTLTSGSVAPQPMDINPTFLRERSIIVRRTIRAVYGFFVHHVPIKFQPSTVKDCSRSDSRAIDCSSNRKCVEPANGIITSHHPPTMRTTNVWWHLKGTHIDMMDPQVASWPSASNPPPSTLPKPVTQGQLKAFKGKLSPWASPLWIGFPHSGTHRLDGRRPSHPSKRPTREASKLGRSKPPFNLWHKFAFMVTSLHRTIAKVADPVIRNVRNCQQKPVSRMLW